MNTGTIQEPVQELTTFLNFIYSLYLSSLFLIIKSLIYYWTGYRFYNNSLYLLCDVHKHALPEGWKYLEASDQ